MIVAGGYPPWPIRGNTSHLTCFSRGTDSDDAGPHRSNRYYFKELTSFRALGKDHKNSFPAGQRITEFRRSLHHRCSWCCLVYINTIIMFCIYMCNLMPWMLNRPTTLPQVFQLNVQLCIVQKNDRGHQGHIVDVFAIYLVYTTNMMLPSGVMSVTIWPR